MTTAADCNQYISLPRRKNTNDKAYWDAYYKSNQPINYPSNFALSILQYLEKGKRLVDLGCGNGRDSLFFAKNGINVIGIDSSHVAINELLKHGDTEFICGDFTNNAQVYQSTHDYFYSRFTLHAINEGQQNSLIKNVYTSLKPGGFFFIEARSIHDDIFGKGEPAGRNAFIYDKHYRRFIISDELISDLLASGFKILYNKEARGFAKTSDNDPMIIRVITQKTQMA